MTIYHLKKDGPANALDYLNDVEKLERIKELDSATKTIKSGQSNFYKTPIKLWIELCKTLTINFNI